MNSSEESIQTNNAQRLMPPNLPSVVLAPLRESLCSLNARVAEEFLALAAMLQSNSTRARQITAESHKATENFTWKFSVKMRV
jgi:hypothetical protein